MINALEYGFCHVVNIFLLFLLHIFLIGSIKLSKVQTSTFLSILAEVKKR